MLVNKAVIISSFAYDDGLLLLSPLLSFDNIN